MKERIVIIDPYSLLFVANDGLLKRIYCPFKVRFAYELSNEFEFNQIYIVNRVSINIDDKIKFRIGNEYQDYHLFEILI